MRRKICCGVCIGILVILLGVGIGLGVYINNIYKNASAPTIKFYETQYDVVASLGNFGFTGTSTFSVQNNNKVAITISEAVLPILYPTTNDNGDQAEIGNCTIKAITVPSGATLNNTMSSVTGDLTTSQKLAMLTEFLGTAQSVQYKITGTINGQATVLSYKVHVPVGVDCTLTIYQNPLGSTNTDCSFSTGSITVGRN
jgi:hypothetical protein